MIILEPICNMDKYCLLIGLMGRDFANGLEDLGSIPDRVFKNGTWYLFA